MRAGIPRKNNVPIHSSTIAKKFNLTVSVPRGTNRNSGLTNGRIKQAKRLGRRSCSAACRHSWRNTCFNKFICHVTMRNGMQNFLGSTPMLLAWIWIWIWIWFRGGRWGASFCFGPAARDKTRRKVKLSVQIFSRQTACT